MLITYYRVEFWDDADWQLGWSSGDQESAIKYATELAQYRAAVRVVRETTEIILQWK